MCLRVCFALSALPVLGGLFEECKKYRISRASATYWVICEVKEGPLSLYKDLGRLNLGMVSFSSCLETSGPSLSGGKCLSLPTL